MIAESFIQICLTYGISPVLVCVIYNSGNLLFDRLATKEIYSSKTYSLFLDYLRRAVIVNKHSLFVFVINMM